MRIVYLFAALDTVGGADRVIIEKANYFANQQGNEVYVITTHQNNKPMYFPLSPRVKHIDLGVNFVDQYGHTLPVRAYIYLKLLRRYRKLLSQTLCELKPDITVSIISRDIDFLNSVKDGSLKVAEAHLAKPFLRNLHLMKAKGGLNRIVAHIYMRKMEKAIEQVDALVLLTDRDAKAWEPFTKPYVIPNSLPFYPEQSSTCKNKKIISVGRFEEQKGYEMLIDAWQWVHAAHPDWVLTIYGIGTLQASFEKRIRERNLDGTLVLAAPVKDIEAKYLESSIYVMSSRYEGFGMVLAEAMACGVPCVSFDCPHGPSDIIRDGEDGLLVENGNVAQLAEKINYLIEHDDLRRQMGAKAKVNIGRYQRETIMQRWVKLFDELMQH